MNTQKSDQLVAEWARRSNPLQRASVTCQKTFQTTPEKLFALLCPTTEYDWIPNWRCELLHSKSGYAEYDAVFRTDFFGPQEIWVCTRYEPHRAIDYSRVSQDFCGKLEISLSENGDGTVTGRWVATASALTAAGNSAVAELQSAGKHLEELLEVLDDYVNNGRMLS